MAIIQCTECKHEVSDKAKTCPACGAPVERHAPKTHIVALLVAIAFVIILVLAALLVAGVNSPDSDDEIASEAEQQWVQQFKDPSSVEWQDVVVTATKKADQKAVCGTVNARNAFGAYVGAAAFGGIAFLDAKGHFSGVSDLVVENDPDTDSITGPLIQKICGS